MNSAILVPLFTVYILWGSTYLAIHYAVETLPPILMAAVRFLTAGGIFYLWGTFRKYAQPTLRHWWHGLVIGAFLLAGANGLVVIAQKQIPSGMAALIVSIIPLWMVILDWITQPTRQSPTLWTWGGLVGGFFGIALLVGPSAFGAAHSLHFGGALALCLAAFLWAIGSIYSRRAPQPSSHTMSTAIQMLCGGALLLIISLLKGDVSSFEMGLVSARSLWALIYLIVFGALIGFTAYTWLLKTAPISVASTYAYVNPVVALFLGWLVAGEVIVLRTFIASIIIILSVVVITSQRRV